MDRFLAAVILGGVAIAQVSMARAKPGLIASPQSALKSASAPGDLPTLPPAPKGKSTILGGEIRNVDPVRDQFILKVFGKGQVKVLFDERTEVYLDGKRIPLRDLRSQEHGSVQTVLDGTDVFALSIHMLSRAPEGNYQGRVLDYNPATNELTLSAALSRKPIKLVVPLNTPLVREGQAAITSANAPLSDLVKGTLISVTFESDQRSRGVATQIAILATPGSAFVFSGTLSSIDMHSGLMVLVDPRDGKKYEVSFDTACCKAIQNLHEGDDLRVTTTYDGSRYVASAITVN